jgi:hypothetical protein
MAHTLDMRPFAVPLPELLMWRFCICLNNAVIAKKANDVWISFSRHGPTYCLFEGFARTSKLGAGSLTRLVI